jgi:hypothetical protein
MRFILAEPLKLVGGLKVREGNEKKWGVKTTARVPGWENFRQAAFAPTGFKWTFTSTGGQPGKTGLPV